jgi:hypothetical protein
MGERAANHAGSYKRDFLAGHGSKTPESVGDMSGPEG